MVSKTISFAKNLGLAAVAGLTAGAGTAELTSLVTDNNSLIATASTLSEYLAAYAVFLPLHARANKDIYQTEDKKFRWKSFFTDQAKLAAGFAILDAVYLLGRPFIAKKFLENGLDPSHASLYSDGILYPSLTLATFPIAKITGNLRSKKD